MIRYFGLDFESSGSDPWGRSAPIQIGIANEAVRITAYIGGWNWSEWEWNEEAAEVHKIDRKGLDKFPPVWKVDIAVAAQLLDHAVGDRMWNVPVGWNVAGFDRQFVTRHMPNLHRLLSYRSVDLNAVLFSKVSDEHGYTRLKKAVKARAEAVVKATYESENVTPTWHDALFDAEAALAAFRALQAGEFD
jgi:hypothetical protein